MSIGTFISARLHEAIAAVCPIDGVAITGPQTARIDYAASATAPQRAAADSALAAFDWSQAAQDTWELRGKTRLIGQSNAARKAADEATSSASFIACAGLAFELAPNSHYGFRFVGAYTAAAGTTGLQLAVTGPASPVLVRGIGQIAEGAAAIRFGTFAGYDVAIAGVNSGGATAMPFVVEGSISTGAAGGPFGLRFRSEVAGSAVTILQGSIGYLFGAN